MYCAPCPMLTTAMTAATPITIPSIVRADRILLRASARKARRNVFRNSMILLGTPRSISQYRLPPASAPARYLPRPRQPAPRQLEASSILRVLRIVHGRYCPAAAFRPETPVHA